MTQITRIRHSYHDKSFPPIDQCQLRRLDDAAERLLTKLNSLNVADLPVPSFLRDHIVELQKTAEETVTKYVHILAWSLYPELRQKYSAFVDYGGGHGVLTCLIKEADIADLVIYNDIFDESCSGARELARHLGCEADAYVCGDIAAVKGSLDGRRLASCAVASINVIEHIYDLDDFLRTAAALTEGPMTMVLSTSANPFNPLVRRRHHRQHNEWEFSDGPHESSYPFDTVKAFRSVRREIIQACAQHLSVADVEMLTSRTRGMRKDDIEKAVRLFELTHQLPPEPSHPTNTCDPITGSWQERLLDVPTVTRTFEESGFSVTVLPGYYSGMSRSKRVRRVKKVAASMLNRAVAHLGPQGVRLGPCFMFHGARR
jgi:2-polyprenyl-3-methyl-5-hydroxy-6-metoxy-1,4-benzoquinol methylase